MKFNTRKLILAGASAVIILVAVIGLIHPARLSAGIASRKFTYIGTSHVDVIREKS